MPTQRSSKFPTGPVVKETPTHPHTRPHPGTSKFGWKASDIQIAPRVPIVGKAAIYTRVSTDRQQDGASLEVQLESCRTYCERNGLVVVAEFKDVLSGLNPDRPQYREAVALASSNAVSKLIVWRLDRLGRDLAEYATQLRDLKRRGVDVVSVTQPGESLMMQQMAGVFAEQESRDKSVRISASKLHRARSGKWNGAPPFGYKTQRAPDGGNVLVASKEAPLIREMFKRYATGKHSLRDLRDYLNEHGWLKSRFGIYTILKNTVYLGMVRHGRFSNSPFSPRPEITEYQGQHSALVDRKTFDKVQLRLRENKSRMGGGTRPKYLFSGLIYCGSCGLKYTGRHSFKTRAEGRRIDYVDYKCNRKVSTGDCISHNIGEIRLRAEVIAPIEALMTRLRPESVRAKVRAELIAQQRARDSAGQLARSGLQARSAALEARLARLEDAYIDGGLAKDRYLVRRDETNAELAEIKAKLASLAVPELADDVDQLFTIADSLNSAPPDGQEWREIVAELVERIEINDRKIKVAWRDAYAPLLVRMA